MVNGAVGAKKRPKSVYDVALFPNNPTDVAVGYLKRNNVPCAGDEQFFGGTEQRRYEKFEKIFHSVLG